MPTIRLAQYISFLVVGILMLATMLGSYGCRQSPDEVNALIDPVGTGTEDPSIVEATAEGEPIEPEGPTFAELTTDGGHIPAPWTVYQPDGYRSYSVWSLLVGRISQQPPWGVASSHNGSKVRNISIWAPVIRAAGITNTRGFDQNYLNGGDSALRKLKANDQRVTGILISGDTFPLDMRVWRTYVRNMLRHYQGKIRYWEVWNEPPNFSKSEKPEEYARIVIEAYRVAKRFNPRLQLGLAARSVELNFLDRAFAAVPELSDHFDFVTLHPYETFDYVEKGWEQAYMSVRKSVQRMLKVRSPKRVHVPVWFTEIGKLTRFRCEGKNTIGVTSGQQASAVVQAFTMGIAQGAARINWFEAKDGDGNATCTQLDDDDRELSPRCSLVPLGLINGCTGKARPALTALRVLIKHLGQHPHYLGWLTFDEKHFGFLFRGKRGVTMVSWAQPKDSFVVNFTSPATLVTLRGRKKHGVEWYRVGSTPVIFSELSEDFAIVALNNLSKPFPWGGDFTDAKVVRFDGSGLERGLHISHPAFPRMMDGVEVYDASQYGSITFGVDRNFMLYNPERIRVTVVVRRNDPKVSAGFNFKYESTEGYIGYNGPGAGWYTIPGDGQWHTRSWEIDDPQFVGRWGYNLAFDSDSTKHSGYSVRSVTITKI